MDRSGVHGLATTLCGGVHAEAHRRKGSNIYLTSDASPAHTAFEAGTSIPMLDMWCAYMATHAAAGHGMATGSASLSRVDRPGQETQAVGTFSRLR